MNRLSVLKYDTVSIALYVGLVSFGIINIYSSSFNESLTNLFDISSIVGVPIGTIKSRINRARMQLQIELKHLRT